MIRIVEHTDLRAHFALQDRLYAGDPCFVPPVRRLDAWRARPFFARGELRLFVAERAGRPVGTMSLLDDPGFRSAKEADTFWFGFFESEDDPAVVEALVGAVTAAARARGAARIRGPRNLTRFEQVGLTVEGHHLPPPFMQGHHLPRYASLLTDAGFVKHHDVLAYDIAVTIDGVQQPLPDGLRAKADACAIPGLLVRATDRGRIRSDLLAAHQILNEAYSTVPDTSPLPLSVWMSLGRTWLAFADHRLLQIAHVNGRPVGFAACFPEINEALVHAHGHLLPLGWWRFLRGLRRVRTASFKLIGVVPDLRGSGLHAKLVAEVVLGVRAAGYERIDGSVIDERNGPMRAVVESAGMRVYRRYRFYERSAA